MVILTEGVHNGSEGAFYYPVDELSKTPVAWDHKPVVVYHPTMNGKGISACSPDVLNTQKVGIMLNTKFEGGRLKSEAWIDKSRVDLVDPRIMQAVANKEMMELSTGVFVDNDPTAGEWKGENYVGIARNLRPDHLALLPDQIGACSIKDGAGFLRNQAGSKPNLVINVLRKALRGMGFVDNELSFSNIRDDLATALRKKFETDMNNGPWLYVEDVYSNFVIYSLGEKLYRLGYTSSDTGITLSDETPVEVVRVTEYRTISGTFVGNRSQSKPTDPMNKKELVDSIIGLNSVWKETHREQLMTFNEEQLSTLQKALTPKTETPAPAANKAAETPAPAAAPVANKTVVSVTDFIASAPKEIQDVLINGMETHNQAKAAAIKTLLANANNPFTKEDLESRTLKDLQAMLRLAGAATPVANYGGQAPVPSGGHTETPLVIPTLNFEPKKS